LCWCAVKKLLTQSLLFLFQVNCEPWCCIKREWRRYFTDVFISNITECLSNCAVLFLATDEFFLNFVHRQIFLHYILFYFTIQSHYRKSDWAFRKIAVVLRCWQILAACSGCICRLPGRAVTGTDLWDFQPCHAASNTKSACICWTTDQFYGWALSDVAGMSDYISFQSENYYHNNREMNAESAYSPWYCNLNENIQSILY